MSQQVTAIMKYETDSGLKHALKLTLPEKLLTKKCSRLLKTFVDNFNAAHPDAEPLNKDGVRLSGAFGRWLDDLIIGESITSGDTLTVVKAAAHGAPAPGLMAQSSPRHAAVFTPQQISGDALNDGSVENNYADSNKTLQGKFYAHTAVDADLRVCSAPKPIKPGEATEQNSSDKPSAASSYYYFNSAGERTKNKWDNYDVDKELGRLDDDRRTKSTSRNSKPQDTAQPVPVVAAPTPAERSPAARGDPKLYAAKRAVATGRQRVVVRWCVAQWVPCVMSVEVFPFSILLCMRRAVTPSVQCSIPLTRLLHRRVDGGEPMTQTTIDPASDTTVGFIKKILRQRFPNVRVTFPNHLPVIQLRLAVSLSSF